MKYTAKTDEEFAKEEAEALKKLLMADGVYDFEVIDAEEKTSSKGNDMIMLTLTVYDESGEGNKITDYLVPGSTYGNRKIRHAAVACGLTEQYETEKLAAEDFTGRAGKLRIKIQKGTKDYPKPKNTVDDYLAKDGSVVVKAKPKADKSVDEDSIPF